MYLGRESTKVTDSQEERRKRRRTEEAGRRPIDRPIFVTFGIFAVHI
jgi:hypothetical protein